MKATRFLFAVSRWGNRVAEGVVNANLVRAGGRAVGIG